MAKNRRRTQEKRTKQNRRQVNQIHVLPDDVLLEIFDFYVDMGQWQSKKRGIDAWHFLVHVCRRWRNLVFQSPRRLNLRLYCTHRTSTKDTLDVWPALPLFVASLIGASRGIDNTIAALGQSNRVCQIDLLIIAGWQLEKFLAAMEVPFPELTDLRLRSGDEIDETFPDIPVPDSFLGGSAPTLRQFSLSGIPFPGLPKLLLSATHLVKLWLPDIPHSGYISPEAIVALISVLSSLEALSIGFNSRQPRPGRESRRLPPPKRSILPALNELHFRGVTEYLEELMSLIDTPQLNVLHITFFDQIDFYCPRLGQFINCTPTLKAVDEARVEFCTSTVSVKLRHRTSQDGDDDLEIEISCDEPDMQVSFVEQLCNTSLPPVHTVEDLYIEAVSLFEDWEGDDIEDTVWLRLLFPFTAVRNLYISREIVPGIAAALEEVVDGRITEVLPGLQNIFVDELEPFQENIDRFVAARQLSGYPITISEWDISLFSTRYWKLLRDSRLSSAISQYPVIVT